MCVCVCVRLEHGVWLCACVCGRGWCVLARHRSHFPSRLNIMQIHTHTHTPRKRWNIITVRAAVSRPLTQAALCSNTDAHTHTHTLAADPDSGLPYRQYNYSYYIWLKYNFTSWSLALSLSLCVCILLDLPSFPSYPAFLTVEHSCWSRV